MEEDTKYIINRTEKANSWETGPTGNRFKIYFEDAEDLKKQIEELKKIGLNIDN